MKLQTGSFLVRTGGFSDVCNLTDRTLDVVKKSRFTHGLVTLFVPGSTAGITTIEFEPGVIEDLKRALARWAPENIPYDHDARWGDGNGFSHIRASLIGPSLSVPLGAWFPPSRNLATDRPDRFRQPAP